MLSLNNIRTESNAFVISLSLGLFLIGVLISLIIHDPDTANNSSASPPGARFDRIITLSPTITEYVYALDGGDDIIAVGNFCNFPPDTERKIKVGDLITPNFEKILTLEPDCIIIQGNSPKLALFCKRHQIRFIRLRFDDLDAIYNSISLLGNELNRRGEASKLAGEIKTALDAVQAATALQERVKTLICVNRSKSGLHDISTINSKGFLGELVSISGGENIFAGLDRDYSQVNVEFIIRQMPEIIIEFRPGESLDDATFNELIEDWQALSTVPAVASRRVYLLTEEFFLVQGPRIPAIAKRLFDIFHETDRFSSKLN